MSTLEGNREFCVHIKKEYDYWFESDFKREFVDACKQLCWTVQGKNVLVYHVPDSLKWYHTGKKDAK